MRETLARARGQVQDRLAYPMLAQCGMDTEAGKFNTVNAYLTWDHDRLDKLLANVADLAQKGDAKHVERQLAHYERGMRRHMRIEEQILDQLYAFDRTGATKSPTQTLQAEHGEIARQLDEMHQAGAAHDLGKLNAKAVGLQAHIAGRHARQQTELYPLVDSLLGAAEAQKLITRLRAE